MTAVKFDNYICQNTSDRIEYNISIYNVAVCHFFFYRGNFCSYITFIIIKILRGVNTSSTCHNATDSNQLFGPISQVGIKFTQAINDA